MERPSSSPKWLDRYGLSAVVVLAMPLIFLVFNAVAGGLTPDSRCALCPTTAVRAEIPPGLTDIARSEATVRTWVELERERLANLTTLPTSFAWDGNDPRSELEVMADDLQARYGYAVPTGLLILLSIPVAVAAFIALPAPPSFWRRFYLAGVILAIVLGIEFQDSHPVRLFTAEYLLGVAALSTYPFLSPETWEFTFQVVNVATVTGMTATASLIVLFSWLASGPANADPPLSREEIRARVRTFKLALTMGSLVLILAVAGTHGLFAWSPVLLEPVSRTAVESLGSSAAVYWGVIHSLTLLAVSLPAGIRLQREIRRTAQEPRIVEDSGASPNLARDVGFDFDLRRSISTILTLAAPLMTGPFLDLLRNLSGAV